MLDLPRKIALDISLYQDVYITMKRISTIRV